MYSEIVDSFNHSISVLNEFISNPTEELSDQDIRDLHEMVGELLTMRSCVKEMFALSKDGSIN